MDTKKTPEQILAQRQHRFIDERGAQLYRNLLALKGGRPYIDDRLQRFPAEKDSQYDARKLLSNVPNHFQKTVTKINDFVMEQEPEREGIDEDFAEDVSMSADRHTITDLMKDVSSNLSAMQWCWVRVDRPAPMTDAEGNPILQTVADKQARGDRVYWEVYNPLQVVDFFFEEDGRLGWLLTEDVEWKDDDPMAEPVAVTIRKLWFPDVMQRYALVENNGELEAVLIEERRHDSGEVPFVLVGKPSDCPHKWDDVENLQSSILNLLSSHQYSLLRSQFPQLVLPASMFDRATEAVSGDAEARISDLVLGLNNPVIESETDKGTTRFLIPPAGEAMVLREEVARITADLYEIVGLHVRKMGMDAESAEAKRIDKEDIAAVCKARADELEATERKLVKLSMQLDSTFAEYDPIYNKDFNNRALEERFQSYLQFQQVEMTDAMLTEWRKVGIEMLSDIAGADIAEDVKEQMILEIESQGVSDSLQILA